MADTPASSLSVIILGCGRVGSTLARQMALEGHHVTIIDLTSDAFRRLGPRFKGTRVVGTGLDRDTLLKAGIERTDIFIAVTQGDNSNIMAAQIARQVFEVSKVIARIYDPIRSQAYREMGIQTLCTTTLAANLIHSFALDTPLTTPRDNAAWQETVAAWDRQYLEQVG
jgi:trk system potassium uptake protein TrkA